MNERAMVMVHDGSAAAATRQGLREEVTTIGRWDESDVCLAHREVSRSHCLIRHEAGRYVLVDLGSKNGTLLNGTRIERAAVLTDGDEILVPPHFKLIFVDHEATAPAAGRQRGVRIDPESRDVWLASQRLEPALAPNQFALLTLLCNHPGKVYSRTEIAAACYPDAPEGSVSDQAIDGVVRRLRSRMTAIDGEGEHIVAVRGHGFRLLTPVLRTR